MNTLGQLFKIASYGESHGKVIGVVIDGCPAGIEIDESAIAKQLSRRRPGQSHLSTSRNETEVFEILSGVFEGKSTGAPIVIQIPNKDAQSGDYDHLKAVYRPSHADYTYHQKYGHRDHRGGGRSSARITAGWVAAGAIATQILNSLGIEILAWVNQIYNIKCELPQSEITTNLIEDSLVRCPDKNASQQMIEAIEQAKNEGDSLGGIIACVINNCPVGLGEPIFDKFNASLGKAILSLNAVKGVQFGIGFDAVNFKGSELNDGFTNQNGKIVTNSNHSGGIQGGITNGMPVYFETAFKPTATISKMQETVDIAGNPVQLEAKGRHDPCVVPRAVPIIEALTAITTLDFVLMQKAYNM